MAGPTRQELLDLCDRGIVPEDQWGDRDSYAAQTQLGTVRALLAAGCAFVVDPKVDLGCHWVNTSAKGFAYFDYDGGMTTDRFYVPTAERLNERAGGDWY